MKKLFLLLAGILTFVLSASAQTHKVTGTVTDEEGEPLTGVSVVPIGGGNGAATDIDGKFSIQVPASVKTIRFSYVGMLTQELPVSSTMDVVMKNSINKLDEVMVVAYGTAKKSAFTGSATVIDAGKIEQAQVSNALSVLTGKVPGVQTFSTSGQPGSGPSAIRIRGISSLNAGNSPLYVVDGAPFGGDINQINPNDIASMTVLKDAAANALYGARGANGVVLITTKKGQNAGSVVTFDAKIGGNSRATRDYNTIKNPALYYEVYYDAVKNGLMNDTKNPLSATEAWQQANAGLINSTDFGLRYNIWTLPDDQMLIGSNGKLNPNATLGRMYNYRGNNYWVTPDNWLDNTYEKSMRQEYNVSISSTTESTNFYMSAGYLKNEGIIPNTSFDRFSGRLAADKQVKSWLKVGANMAYTYFDNKSMSGDGSGSSTVNPLAFATGIAPIYPLYMRDGNGMIMTNVDGLIMYDYGDGSFAGLSRPSFPGANGLSSVIYNTNKTNGNTINANGYFDVRFLKDFKFTSNNTVYVQEVRGTSVSNPYFGGGADQGGIVSKSHSRYMEYQFQQLLTWHHNFGLHEVDILLGHENSWQKNASLSADKSGMFSPGNHELNGAAVDGSMGSYTTDYNNEGWLGRAQWNYDNKYFGSASFRRDGSSRFAPGHRWGNFWSVGGAWIISKESWFQAPWVNMLKFKASYGEQGNDNIGNYIWTNTYTVVNSGGKPALVPGSVKGNPEITWEKNGNFNAGVEFELFNTRLGGNIEGFYRKTSDMLYQKGLPVSQGFTNMWMNFGDMMNAGIEIELNGSIIRTRDFTWDANVNLTWFKNEVTRLPEESRSNWVEGYNGSGSGGYYIAEGLPMYTYYCLDYAGVNDKGQATYWKNVYKRDENKNIIRDEHGQPVVDHRVPALLTETPDRYLCGSALANVYGGFGTSFTFKGFDLSVDFAYQIGGQVMDSSYKALMSSPSSSSIGNAIHADVLKSWTAENPNSDIPRWSFGDEDNQASNRFLTDASFLSLQNVNFGYTFPTQWIQKLHLSKLRLYVAGENLYLWSKRQGLDPRQSISGSNTNTYYSPIRTISGGVTVSF